MRRSLIVAGLTAERSSRRRFRTPTDLAEYLDRAAESEYSGEVFVVCDTPDGTVAQFVEVTRSAGVLWVRTSDNESVSADGELYQRAADGTVQATRIDSSAGWKMSSKYTALEAGRVRELERPAQIVTVMGATLSGSRCISTTPPVHCSAPKFATGIGRSIAPVRSCRSATSHVPLMNRFYKASRRPSKSSTSVRSTKRRFRPGGWIRSCRCI